MMSNYRYSTVRAVTIVVVVLLLVHHTQAATLPCMDPRRHSAFVSGIVAGLPPEVQDTFCDNGAARLSVRPEDMGVQQFVLSGHIPRRLIGKQGSEWQLVQHGPPYPHDTDTLPAMLHLWIKAHCVR